MVNIKEYRRNELQYFVIANILLMLVFNEAISIEEIITTNSSELINIVLASTLFASIIYMVIFVIDSLIPTFIKEKLVFWCNDLPGELVFSKISEGKYCDNRFINADVINVYKCIYDNMPKGSKEMKRYENSKWYEIYKKYEERSSIFYANSEYLMCRDMTCASVSLALLYLLITSIVAVISFEWQLMLVFVAEYIALCISTRLKAKRLVLSVLAIDVAVYKESILERGKDECR